MKITNYPQPGRYTKILISLTVSFIIFATPAPITRASAITEQNLLVLINHEREQRNITPLAINADLEHASLIKSRRMLALNKFDHTINGITPWDLITNTGYNYSIAGENLAMNFNTAEGVVRAWMNSPTHRDNILNPEFQDIGFGISEGNYTQNNYSFDTIMVTNIFGHQKTVFNRTIEALRRLMPLY